VKANSETRSEIIQIVDIFRADIVDVADDSVTVEVTGDEDKIDSLLSLLRSFGIKEMSRTGRIAMTRGGSSLLTEDKDKTARRSRNKAASRNTE
jgi:acetolactate synthase-1/3 small subunit